MSTDTQKRIEASDCTLWFLTHKAEATLVALLLVPLSRKVKVVSVGQNSAQWFNFSPLAQPLLPL